MFKKRKWYKKKEIRQIILDKIKKEIGERIKENILKPINEIIKEKKQNKLIEKIKSIYALGKTITDNTHIEIKINFNRELGTVEVLASDKYIHAVKYHFYQKILFLYQDNEKTNIDTETYKASKIIEDLDQIYRNSKYNKYKKTYNKFN